MATWIKLEGFDAEAARSPEGETDYVAVRYKDVRVNMTFQEVDRLYFLVSHIYDVPDQSFWLSNGDLIVYKISKRYGLKSGACLILLSYQDIHQLHELATQPV